jgi:hypothetical protein
MLLRRTKLPALGSTLIGGETVGIVKRLYELKRRDGVEIVAHLLFDSSLGEAVLKIGVRSSFAEDLRAEEVAEQLRALLVEQGARAMDEAVEEIGR